MTSIDTPQDALRQSIDNLKRKSRIAYRMVCRPSAAYTNYGLQRYYWNR